MDIHSDPLLGPLEKTPEGVRAGDCVLVKKIGQGGMGAVYLGRHTHLDIDVAVKVLPFHAADWTAVSRFQKEARSTVRIDHPNIVRVFDVSEEKGVHYLVMEYVDGDSASARVEREGPLPERDALEIAIGAGEALAAAHAEGILHRDVKPANILIRFRDGRVKLADLGLAKALGGGGRETTDLTATGQMMGTPTYMSPEQATDASRVDERTDIYSLGATLYALLSGKAPFEATQLLKLLLKVTREGPRELRKLRWDVSEETAEAVKKLMRKDPAERPKRMKEAVRLLRDCLDAAPTEGARGLARPELAGTPKVKIAIEAGRPLPAMPKTLDDVTPSKLGHALEAAHRRRRAPTRRAEAPVVARLIGGKKLAIVLGILAAIGAAGGAAAYLYGLARASPSQMEAGGGASRRAEIMSLQRREEDARKTQEERRRKEADAKAASQLKTAQSFLEAGLLDKARDEAAEALKIVPDHAEAKRLLADIQSEIAARQNEAERAADFKKWMDEGLRLRLAGKIEEAARAYERAQASAASGDTKAAEAAAGCLAEHKSQVIDAEARSAYEKAVALTKKDDAATRGAVAEAKKRPDVRRAEEARKTEAARWRSRAEEAERRGDLKAALGYYREAEKASERGHVPGEAGYVSPEARALAAKITSLTSEPEYRDAMSRARSHVRAGAWKEAAAELEGILRSRTGDREASSLLAQVKKHVGPPPTLSIDLDGGVRMEMVYIEPGRFMMGSDGGSNDEKPVHEVVITGAFYLGKSEVTQEHYVRVMGTNPSRFKGAKKPVEQVSWNSAVEFCRKLSQRTGRTFRLPTEAEWEYACRAGSTGKYCFGDEEGKLGEYGWYSKNAGGRTHPVGQKHPNSWGLYDMHGNVWEWCADWYDKAYYRKGPRNDPTGTSAGSARVLRGGSWCRNAYCCRSAYRSWPAPTYRDSRLGFRAAAALAPRP